MSYAVWLLLAVVALVLHFLMPLTGLEQLWLFLGGIAVLLLYAISANTQKILDLLQSRLDTDDDDDDELGRALDRAADGDRRPLNELAERWKQKGS